MELPVRTNPRASRYNYASSGVYFVTICTKDRKEYFGKIVEKKMVLNEIGRICEEELQMMLQKRPSVDMYEYVIMPNHVHLLLSIDDPSNYGRDGSCTRPNNIQNNICPNNTQNNTRSNITQNITHNPKSSGDDRTGMKPVPTTNMTTPVPMANITHQTL
jgi:hypothetical protein